jgi:hypothetical protein
MRLLGPRWRWARRIAVVVVAVVLIVLACWPELPYCVLGWLSNETFYEGRPASLWRKEVKAWCNRTAGRPVRRPFPLSYFSAIFGSGIPSEPAVLQGGPRSLPVLLELIDDPDPKVWSAVIRRLRELGPLARDAIPNLTHALDNPNPSIRDNAAQCLEVIDRKQAAAILTHKALTASAPATQDEVIAWLCCSADENDQAAAAVRDMCRSANKETRLATMNYLTRMPNGLAREQLINWIRSPDKEKRRQAFWFFRTDLGPTGPLPPGSNSGGGWITIEFPSDEAVPIMLDWLNNGDEAWREQTIDWLGSFGPDAADATPELELILQNANDPAYENAWLALKAIGPDEARVFPAPQK